MRACYAIRYTSEASYKNAKIMERVIHGLVQRLKEDPELPVRVEAAMAVQAMLNDQSSTYGGM